MSMLHRNLPCSQNVFKMKSTYRAQNLLQVDEIKTEMIASPKIMPNFSYLNPAVIEAHWQNQNYGSDSVVSDNSPISKSSFASGNPPGTRDFSNAAAVLTEAGQKKETNKSTKKEESASAEDIKLLNEQLEKLNVVK